MATISRGELGLGVLGDPTRRAIFTLLARAPAAVGDIARSLPVSRPAVSQHLRILKDAGLVSLRRDGKRSIYRADPGGIAVLCEALEQYRCSALLAFGADREPVA
jgi:DNA-binding transcriptional ArsR family regulator